MATTVEINGQEAELESYIISGTTDPSEATVGNLGQFYKNTTSGNIYRCISITAATSTTPAKYHWKKSIVSLGYSIIT